MLTVSISPHLKSEINIPWIMRQVLVALIPAGIASIILFKTAALLLILNCVFSCCFAELLILKLSKKPLSLRDNSAAVSGLLLAFSLSPSTKWYAATIGSVFAMLIGKHAFGGIGCNIFNPALVGRAFIVAAYPAMSTRWLKPFSLEAITSATPLALRKFSHTLTPISDLFWGNVGGCIGETSAFCLIVGGIYLLVRKIADWRIPISMIITVSVISSIFYILNPLNGSLFFHLFSGGFLLGTFFMATDPVTTPVTKQGRVVFGIGCGVLVMILRYGSGLPEGVMYSILFMNALTPLINRYTKPRRFQ